MQEGRKEFPNGKSETSPGTVRKTAAEEVAEVEGSEEEWILEQEKSAADYCMHSLKSEENWSGAETTGHLVDFYWLWPLAVGLKAAQTTESQRAWCLDHRRLSLQRVSTPKCWSPLWSQAKLFKGGKEALAVLLLVAHSFTMAHSCAPTVSPNNPKVNLLITSHDTHFLLLFKRFYNKHRYSLMSPDNVK